MNELKNKALKEYVDVVLEQLAKNQNPWEKPWRTAYNPTTDKEYQGLNDLILGIQQNDDPRYMTYLQAQSQGYQVKRGAKGIALQYFSFYDKKEKTQVTVKEARDPERIENIIPVRKTFTVFNAKDIDHIAPLKEVTEKTHEELNVGAFIERCVERLGITMTRGGQRAYYQPMFDKLNVPSELSFKSNQAELSTLLHELSHATGRENRLQRFQSIDRPEGDAYAKEELVAEMTTLLLKKEFGIDGLTPDSNSISYLQSWHKAIKNDPTYLFDAIKEAEKASEYLLEVGVDKEITPVTIYHDNRYTPREAVETILATAKNDQELVLSMDNMMPSKNVASQYKELLMQRDITDDLVLEVTKVPARQSEIVAFRALEKLKDNPLAEFVDTTMLGKHLEQRGKALRTTEQVINHEIE
ncbi:MAG TPA: DUF1738 domain-containing protein [Tissierellia bacterium]|nr:DUF1738 domain-containing protein [Tissierellia bacterium]